MSAPDFWSWKNEGHIVHTVERNKEVSFNVEYHSDSLVWKLKGFHCARKIARMSRKLVVQSHPTRHVQETSSVHVPPILRPFSFFSSFMRSSRRNVKKKITLPEIVDRIIDQSINQTRRKAAAPVLESETKGLTIC